MVLPSADGIQLKGERTNSGEAESKFAESFAPTVPKSSDFILMISYHYYMPHSRCTYYPPLNSLAGGPFLNSRSKLKPPKLPPKIASFSNLLHSNNFQPAVSSF